MYSVEIKDLSFSFSAVDVLKELNLNIHEGEFLVLLGPSGCGKSTLLNCIAGLLDISAGQIHIGGRNVTWAEPSERGIGMVFQSYALYPQMSVEGNLSFGLKNARMPKDEIIRRISRVAALLQIEHLLKRKPVALSGGQRQRVAIGRALVRDVDVFLFDEPLSNLDAKLRMDLRVELKRLHRKMGNTVIYVTHDQTEAMTLADRIAIMKDGKIMQIGTPHKIYSRPESIFVADFIGAPAMNFVKGTIVDGMFKSDVFNLSLRAYEFCPNAAPVRNATLGIRPEHIQTGSTIDSTALRLNVTIDMSEPMGPDTLIHARIADQTFRLRVAGQFHAHDGQILEIGIDPNKMALFDCDTGMRL